jgi:hypothetical protein
MGIEDINNAAAAMNALTARMNQFVGDADAQIAARRNAYDAIAADLKGIVNTRMYFTAFVDPDEPNPTGGDGGTFNLLADAIDASPAGCFLHITIASGKTHRVINNTSLNSRSIFVISGAGDTKPIVEFTVGTSETHNIVRGFGFSYGGGSINFVSCDIVIAEKGDENLSWTASPAPMLYAPAAMVRVGLYRCSLTGPVDTALASAYTATRVDISVYDCTIDTCKLVLRAGGGVVLISQAAVTLLNGAALTDAGTIGVNMLQN